MSTQRERTQTAKERTHPLVQNIVAYTPIWYIIGAYTKSPDDLLNTALVSKAFHEVFTSDYMWRFYDVHGLECGILDRFSRDIRDVKASPHRWPYQYRESEFTWHLLRIARSNFFHTICNIPDFRFWWCVCRGTQPRFFWLPWARDAAMELLDWFPKADISLRRGYMDREFVLKLLSHNHITKYEVLDNYMISVASRYSEDEEIMMLAMARLPSIAKYSNPRFFSTQEFKLLAQQHGELLRYAPQGLKDDFEYLLAVCNGKQDTTRLSEYMWPTPDPEECTTRDYLYSVIENASPRIRQNSELVGQFLKTATKKVRLYELIRILDRDVSEQAWRSQFEDFGELAMLGL